MRHHLAALLLLAILSLMCGVNVPAAPVPEVSAILDIGPPPKGKTAEKYSKDQIYRLTHYMVSYAWDDPEVRKLPSIASLEYKDACSCMEKKFRITEEEGGRHLRLIFRAGSRAEQVVIINALLRTYLELMAKQRKLVEMSLQSVEESVPRLEKAVTTLTDPVVLDRYQKALASAPSQIAKDRAELGRRKQIKVIKWAK